MKYGKDPRNTKTRREGESCGFRFVATARRGEASPPSKTRREEDVVGLKILLEGGSLKFFVPCDESYIKLTH